MGDVVKVAVPVNGVAAADDVDAVLLRLVLHHGLVFVGKSGQFMNRVFIR